VDEAVVGVVMGVGAEEALEGVAVAEEGVVLVVEVEEEMEAGAEGALEAEGAEVSGEEEGDEWTLFDIEVTWEMRLGLNAEMPPFFGRQQLGLGTECTLAWGSRALSIL